MCFFPGSKSKAQHGIREYCIREISDTSVDFFLTVFSVFVQKQKYGIKIKGSCVWELLSYYGGVFFLVAKRKHRTTLESILRSWTMILYIIFIHVYFCLPQTKARHHNKVLYSRTLTLYSYFYFLFFSLFFWGGGGGRLQSESTECTTLDSSAFVNYFT